MARVERDGCEVPHVFVVSHERSGTHVAIDAIRNNFPVYKKLFYTNIDRMVEGHWSPSSPENIEEEFAEGPRVVKTHMTSDPAEFFDGGGPATRLVERLLDNAKVIYVYRDGRDVLGSLYTFWSRSNTEIEGMSFSEMLKRPLPGHVGVAREGMDAPAYWARHIQGWIEREGVLPISFEALVSSYDESVEKVGEFLAMEPVRPIKCVLRKGSGARRGKIREAVFKWYTRHVKGLDLTSVSFNRGSAGGHRAVYSEADIELFDRSAGAIWSRLGYG